MLRSISDILWDLYNNILFGTRYHGHGPLQFVEHFVPLVGFGLRIPR